MKDKQDHIEKIEIACQKITNFMKSESINLDIGILALGNLMVFGLIGIGCGPEDFDLNINELKNTFMNHWECKQKKKT